MGFEDESEDDDENDCCFMKMVCGERRDGVNLSQLARVRMLSLPGEPLFIADWCDLFFLHFAVDAEVLQREVPFPLDLFEGRAFVSLVSFGLERLRLFQAPTLTEGVFGPFTRSHFLNVRAYVTHGGEPGIYFMQEFLSNRLSIPFGRPLYGLPYHYAAARREIDRPEGCRYSGAAPFQDEARMREQGNLLPAGSTAARAANRSGVKPDGRMDLELHAPDKRALTLRATYDAAERPEPCEAGSLTEFLLERYTAYTCHRGIKRRFRIWHPPWQQRAVAFQVRDEGLLGRNGGWFAEAEVMGGNFAALGKDVWMGRPCVLKG